jgi:hypothetical protein
MKGVSPFASSSRNGGDDGELVSLPDRGVEAAQEADVLVVEVQGDKRVEVALVIAEARAEGGEAGDNVGDGFANGGA